MTWALPRYAWLAAGVVFVAAVAVGWGVGGPKTAARVGAGTLGVGLVLFAVRPVVWWLVILVLVFRTIATRGLSKPPFRPRTGPPPDGAAPPPPSQTPTP